MRDTIPILQCDHEDGCTAYIIDYHSMCTDKWKELLAEGWRFDPYRDSDVAYCPEHAEEADGEDGGS